MRTKSSGKKDGPVLESLTHRLAQCPREFLYKPKIGKNGRIRVDAVVSDLFRAMAGTFPDPKQCAIFRQTDGKSKNWLRLVLLSCWLLHDGWFLERPEMAPAALEFLRKQLQRLSEVSGAESFVWEPERREELARYCLSRLGLLPGGETDKQAADRLDALDSVERVRVMIEAKKAEEHARKVREAMEERKAREAAAKVMRE
jgi:hypothetical protein